MVGMWPPVAAPVQHPVRSFDEDSSQVMITMPFCANHEDLRTGARLVASQESPAAMSWRWLSVAHVEPVLRSPCISWQSLGRRYTKSGAVVGWGRRVGG